jgi:nucleotide-binding universal stress UspA family protein
MTVVLGFDASPAAHAALRQAVDLAAKFGDELVVVYGIDPPGSAGDEARAHAAALEEEGRALCAEALTVAADAGVTAEMVLVRERPARALVQVADERDARLIAVGTYAESPLRGAILGSTPHKLLHLSTRPVLVVPAAS